VTRRQRRRIIIIAVLVVLLLLLAAYYAYYQSTKRLDFDFAPPSDADLLPAPTYLYSFGGVEDDRMLRPTGVYVDRETEEVFVTDARAQRTTVHNLDGEQLRVFGGPEMVVPLYVRKHPVTGEMWISDRRARTIHIYTPEGEYIGEFDPNLPEEELADFETGETVWAPVAFDFAEDGSLYVTEILNGHRLLIFSPEGEFERSVGTVGVTSDAAGQPEFFQFPNSVKVFDDRVWVADSNNRRVKIYDLEGEYLDLIVTEGLPRGLDFLLRSEDASATDKFVSVDTLAHDSTIWNVEGEKIVNFGQRGVLEGQFNYPNDTAIGPRNLIFVTDSSNSRVQVWGWPEEISPVPVADVILYWRWCFAPLLLLPLLLLRKKRFFATKDFVDEMLGNEDVDTMPKRRRRWLATEDDHELIKDYVQQDINLGELFHPAEYSESDTQALMDKLEVDHDTALVLAIAQRAHVFCTEDPELRKYAKTLEIDVVDREEYLERFAKNRDEDSEGPADGGTPGESA
jgi:sugar lactone lactonase YvrE